MNRLIDPNDIHSAADSWSGFIYQGKVALYHVLHLLNSNLNAREFSLQLDSLEDFAIVDEQINLITLHQVKAMKSTAYADYRVAFEKLEKRIREYPCNGAYFHLANPIERTAAQIKTAHPNIEIYQYQNTNNFCSLEQINSVCEEQIEIYLNNILPHNNNATNIAILRNSLEALICNQIIAIHACNHQRDGLTISEGAYHFVVPFQRFEDILHTDPSTLLDSLYFLSLTKLLFNEYFSEFCLETNDFYQENGKDVPDEIREKLDSYLQQLNSLSNNEVISLMRSLLPHRTFKLESIRDFKDNNIHKNEFKYAFMQCLLDLTVCASHLSQGLIWQDSFQKRYTVTAINDGPSSLKPICRSIYENIIDTDYEVPYNTDILITSDLELESLRSSWNRVYDVSLEKDTSNYITKWGALALTTIAKAKTNINENNH